jgi:hypothetical protein
MTNPTPDPAESEDAKAYRALVNQKNDQRAEEHARLVLTLEDQSETVKIMQAGVEITADGVARMKSTKANGGSGVG